MFCLFVDQKIVLFNAVTSENLSMWDSRIHFEQLTKAAKTAHIHEWIINRKDGYEHKLSEDDPTLVVEKKLGLRSPEHSQENQHC